MSFEVGDKVRIKTGFTFEETSKRVGWICEVCEGLRFTKGLPFYQITFSPGVYGHYSVFGDDLELVEKGSGNEQFSQEDNDDWFEAAFEKAKGESNE